MHDVLFHDQRQLEHEDLLRYAAELGLDSSGVRHADSYEPEVLGPALEIAPAGIAEAKP
jgi:hypothetical protein